MNDTLFEIYETDADLSQEEKAIRFQSYHRDITETKAMMLFREHGYKKDFLIYNRKSMKIELLLLSDETAQRRGECQQ